MMRKKDNDGHFMMYVDDLHSVQSSPCQRKRCKKQGSWSKGRTKIQEVEVDVAARSKNEWSGKDKQT